MSAYDSYIKMGAQPSEGVIQMLQRGGFLQRPEKFNQTKQHLPRKSRDADKN